MEQAATVTPPQATPAGSAASPNGAAAGSTAAKAALAASGSTLAPPSGSSAQAGSLVSLSVTKQFDVSLYVDGVTTGGLAIVALAGVLWRYWRLTFGSRDFELNEAEFGLGQQKIKLKPNDDDRQIAYKIWVELSTRKIGLPIDLEQDVVTEVYDSWHTFFSVTRELIKDVPVRKYQRDSTAKIVRLSIEVLNEGLRPHLTKWQARFRRWYEHAAKKEDFGSTAPQEIQKQFPAFAELTEDMKLVNERLIAYRNRMHDLMANR